jgi:flagellar hook-associated protein 2
MATSGVLYSSTLSDYQTQIDAFVASYKTSISTPITTLNTKKDTYTKQKTAISDILTKLKSLSTSLDALTESSISSKFKTNTITSSDTSVLAVTSTGISIEGDYAVSVEQLAKADKVVSSSINGSENNKYSSGSQSFTINVGDTDYNVSVDVSTATTNLDAMKSIMNAINASDAGTKVKATIIQDSDNTQRLVITSKATGSSNAISFKNDSGILSELGISDGSGSRTATSGSNGGYLYTDKTSLNSIFSVDGIEMTRNTNKISDVIQGVTFELKSAQSAGEKNVNVGVTLDRDGVTTLVNNFISSYNDTITFLNQKVAVTTTGTKSEFSGDVTVMDLRQKMRSLIAGKVTGLSSDVNSLNAIGISTNSDGTLTLKDTSKFNSVLENNVEDIANLFNSTDGMATRLSTFVNKYTKTGGILDQKTTNINNQLTSIAERLVTTQDQIDKKTAAVQTKYEKLLSTIIDLQNQQNTMASITSSYNSSTGY